MHSERALCRYPKKEAMMQTPKARFSFALLVPALFALSIPKRRRRSSQATPRRRHEQNASGKPMRRCRTSRWLAPLRLQRETPEVWRPIANAQDEVESVPEAGVMIRLRLRCSCSRPTFVQSHSRLTKVLAGWRLRQGRVRQPSWLFVSARPHASS